MARDGLLMLMEVSKLRELAEIYSDKIAKEAKDQIISMLDRCDDLNVKSQKWSKPCKAYIVEAVDDRLKQSMEDKIMKRYETWLPWPGLVEELRVEFKIAYDKFINVRKKYSELIEKSRGNQRNELIKAYIARDIQDYIKYAINIILFYVEEDCGPMNWIGRIAIHFEVLARTLEGLNVRNEDEVRRLAEDVSLYKQCMFDFGNYLQRMFAFGNYLDVLVGLFDSKSYFMLLDKGGIPFSDLIKRKMNELKFEGKFDNLEYPQQIEVYQGIINEVGEKDASEIQFVEFIFGFENGEIVRGALSMLCHYRLYRIYCKRLGDEDRKEYCITARNDKLCLALPSSCDPAQLWYTKTSDDYSGFMLANKSTLMRVDNIGEKRQLILVKTPDKPNTTMLWAGIEDIDSGYKYISAQDNHYMVVGACSGEIKDGIAIQIFLNVKRTTKNKGEAENQLWKFVPA